jgi:putative ABC transport system permease protein
LVQIGLFLGILDNATITIDRIPADLWVTSRNTPNVDFAHSFPDSRVQRVRSVPGVQTADNLIVQFVNVALPTGAEESTVIYALENFERWSFPWNVVQGNISDLKRGAYVFLDASAAKRFGRFEVGDYREFVHNRLKIIGITKDARSFTTTPISFMDYDLAQRIGNNLANRTSYILVKLAPGANREAVRAEIQRRLPFNDVFTSHEWASRSRNYWIISTGLGLNMFITVFLGCLVGIVVVAQTLYTSTMEHLKEFGTVKAIGGGNSDIYGILTRQATISALVGFVFGAIPSYLVGKFVTKADLKLIIPPALWTGVFVGTILMCLAAALISFRKVASIDPALVFRT